MKAPEWFKPKSKIVRPVIEVKGPIPEGQTMEKFQDIIFNIPDNSSQWDGTIKGTNTELENFVDRPAILRYKIAVEEERQLLWRDRVMEEKLALQAPPAPDWFQPTAMEMPQKPSINIPVEHTRTAESYFAFGGDMINVPEDIKQKIHAYEQVLSEYQHELEKWQIDAEQERLLQWPFYYAQQVIARRNAERK